MLPYFSDMFPLSSTFKNVNAGTQKKNNIFSGALSVYLTAAQYIDFYYLEYKDYILKD